MYIKLKLNKERITYLAGFIDADGTISIKKVRNKGSKYAPFVGISNTNRPVIDWFKHIVGKGAICTKKARNERESESYEIRWEYNTALKIAKLCYPYLRVKKDRAELLLNEWKSCTPRNGRYTTEMWDKKLDLIGRMRILNAKGGNKMAKKGCKKGKKGKKGK